MKPLGPVWFERPVPAALEAEVTRRLVVCGPGSTPPDATLAGLPDAVGLVASAGVYDADLMEHAPRLRVIARTGIGYDRVDVTAATARGIAVCNTPDASTVSTAEHTLAILLSVAKNLQVARRRQLADDRGDLYAAHSGIELSGRTLGLVGCGRIGRRVARYGRALGMQVLAYDPRLSAADFPTDVTPASSLEVLLGAADVVSLHVPLTDDTRLMLDRETLQLMRPGAILVNTARGGLVDQAALQEALAAGRLAGAALDVTEPEPLPADHPLLARDDVVVTPHVATATVEAKLRILRAAIEQVVDVLEGRLPRHLVNPQVLASAPTFRPTEAGGGS